MGAQENKLQIIKSFKFHKLKSYAWRFYLCFLSSCEIWNLFSQAPKWEIVFGIINKDN